MWRSGWVQNKKQDLCTTEALRHGETQKIDELFWPPGTLGLFQGAVSLFQTSSHQQKAEDTEVLNLPLLACIRTMTQICAKNKNLGRGNTETRSLVNIFPLKDDPK